jgi:hypothetical protein
MAAYKFDTLATETVAWTTPGGNAIEVIVSLVQESTDFFGNGEWAIKRDGLTVTTATKVAGKNQPTDWVQPVKGHPEFINRIGAIGLNAERSALVEAAYTAVKSHPAWVAKLDKTSAGIAASREYDAHTKAVAKMMQPGGSY